MVSAPARWPSSSGRCCGRSRPSDPRIQSASRPGASGWVLSRSATLAAGQAVGVYLWLGQARQAARRADGPKAERGEPRAWPQSSYSIAAPKSVSHILPTAGRGWGFKSQRLAVSQCRRRPTSSRLRLDSLPKLPGRTASRLGVRPSVGAGLGATTGGRRQSQGPAGRPGSASAAARAVGHPSARRRNAKGHRRRQPIGPPPVWGK